MPDPGAQPGPDDALDAQLVTRIRNGDQQAWTELLTRYQDRLFGVCLRMIGTGPQARQTASDLCQESMVKVIQGLHTFDNQAKLSTWMIRVTMNVCLSHLRSQKLRRHASLDSPRSGNPQQPGGAGSAKASRSGSTLYFQPLAQEPDSDLRIQHDEDVSRVARALSKLDSDQRAILVLRDVRGLDYEHIAQVLSLQLGTVKSRIFRARMALKAILEAEQRKGP